MKGGIGRSRDIHIADSTPSSHPQQHELWKHNRTVQIGVRELFYSELEDTCTRSRRAVLVEACTRWRTRVLGLGTGR